MMSDEIRRLRVEAQRLAQGNIRARSDTETRSGGRPSRPPEAAWPRTGRWRPWRLIWALMGGRPLVGTEEAISSA